MKLTKKTVKHEVEETEAVCEITKSEFEQLCAQVAAHTVVETIGNDPDIDDIIAGISLTRIFANLCAGITSEMFADNTENPDKNEKEEK